MDMETPCEPQKDGPLVQKATIWFLVHPILKFGESLALRRGSDVFQSSFVKHQGDDYSDN